MGAAHFGRPLDVRHFVNQRDLPYPYVFTGSEIETHEILKDDPELPTQVIQVVIAEVFAVQEDASFCRVVEPDQEFDQGRLAGPVFAYQRGDFSGTQGAREIPEDITVGVRVAKGDIAEFDALSNGPSYRE
ncbi:MAG: hypothetical protein JW395_2762 [Nitrospira sp.]|nr:hypothetical protein [Nitrospira sp.]